MHENHLNQVFELSLIIPAGFLAAEETGLGLADVMAAGIVVVGGEETGLGRPDLMALCIPVGGIAEAAGHTAADFMAFAIIIPPQDYIYRLVNFTITHSGIYKITARTERTTIRITSFLCDDISLSFNQSKKQDTIRRISNAISPQITK